ncbi:MAG: lamin tail domain-containing protein, partial [Butyricicoccus sp.]
MKKKPIKLKQWVSGTLSATVLLSCMNTVVFAAEASPAAVQKPELMVTELVPDTENFTGTDGKASDAYEFIELYNPSETETRNLSEYNLVYYNGTKDYSWSLTGLTQENDITLTPGETLVIWVRNEDVAAVKTVEDFRSHYGLAENVKVAAITAGGMRNSATGTADGCGIRIQKDGAEIARAYYNENKSSQVQPDKAFTFGYGADGSAVLRMLSSAADPTPGTVDADSLLPPTTNPDPEPEPEPSPEPAALLITELLPNSSNMNKADAYEFVEVYNNSNKRINLKDYRLYYNNNLDASDNDVLWASFDKDLYLESGACMVFWIHNGSNDTLTVDDFNKKFGTNLVENQNIIILENGGMSNSAPRGLRITTNVHDEVNYVTYNVGENDANGNDHADKTITYRYDGTKSVKVSNVDTPTPGFIPTDLASVGATLQVPKAEPTVKDNTPETFDNDEGLTFSVTATSDGTTIKTVKLSYKDAKMQNYETYNLTRDGSGDDFKLTLTPADLTAKSSYTYYFTVSDGFKTVTTPVKTTSSTKVSEGDIHFNVTENEWISGTKRIITTGDTLQIGSNTMTAATPSIENKAKFIFEASQTDTFFKNAAAIGSDVLGIFNDGTYGEWKTYAYDVDPAYFTKGQTTTIDIHAGNKSNVLVHDAENNDDFVVRNIRLILPDGTTLRAESYVAELGKDVAEKNDKTYQKNYGVAENIKMGDSKNTVEILHVNFKPEDAAYNGIAYNLGTTKLPDGKVTISGSTGEQSQTVTVRVDNTAPAVQSNIENGQQYKGGNEIRVDVTDSGSGVASQTVK